MFDVFKQLPFLKNRCSVRVKKAGFTERPLLAQSGHAPKRRAG
jgi:hypothetical protein